MRASFLFLSVVVFGVVCFRATAQNEVPLDNPGLEEPYLPVESREDESLVSGEVAEFWQLVNLRSEVECAQETVDVHEGKSAQRVSISTTQKSETEFGLRIKSLRPGATYRFTIWLKSDTFSQVRLFVRQSGSPYTVYGSQTLKVTPEWEAFSVDATVSSSDVRLLLGLVTAPAVYWIDSLQVEESTGS